MNLQEIQKELEKRGFKSVHFSWGDEAHKMSREELTAYVEMVLTDFLEGKGTPFELNDAELVEID